MEKIFNIGDVVPVQWGNPGERGYMENKPSLIIGEKDVKFVGKLYLIKPDGVDGLIGVATAVHEGNASYVKGELYCTDGRYFGPSTEGTILHLKTLEEAKASLDF